MLVKVTQFYSLNEGSHLIQKFNNFAFIYFRTSNAYLLNVMPSAPMARFSVVPHVMISARSSRNVNSCIFLWCLVSIKDDFV